MRFSAEREPRERRESVFESIGEFVGSIRVFVTDRVDDLGEVRESARS
jgi:hypothetical protein